jgi:hypothetical protein
MKTINEQHTAAQKFFAVCSKIPCSFDSVGVWAFSKTEAKQEFKKRNPDVAFSKIHASQADY